MANQADTTNVLTIVKAYSRAQCIPVDNTELWYSLGDEVNPAEGTARYYAANDPTAYIGQTIKVLENETITPYLIGYNGELLPITSNVEIPEVEAIPDSEIISLFS